MFSQVFLCLGLVVPVLSSLTITDPNGDTPWAAGVNQTIKWIENNSTGGITLEQFGPSSISIYVGNAKQQTSLQTIANSLDVSKVSSVSFVPDPTIGPNSADYFIRIQSNSFQDTSVTPPLPALAFSGKFKLTNMTGKFNDAIIAQINGQSTAPLVSPTSTTGGSTATSAATLTTPSSIHASSTVKASDAGSGAHPTQTSGVIGLRMGWMGAAAGMLAAAALLI